MIVYVVTETWNGDIGTKVLGVFLHKFQAQGLTYDRRDILNDTEYEHEIHEIEVTE